MFTELYEYQKEAVEQNTSGKIKIVLDGSEMGTGKTHTAIATMIVWREQVRKETGLLLPILVVCPLNVFESWNEKLAQQAPQLKVKTVDTKHRQEFINSIYNLTHDVYIVHWQAIRLIERELNRNDIMFSVVVGDEIHYIANRNAEVTKSFKRIKTLYKYAMSGTASGSVPWNLWSILNWLKPKEFSAYWKFVEKYAITENDYYGGGSYRKFVGVKNANVLQWTIQDFYIKHLKREKCCEHHPNGVMPYLPEKVYEKLYVDLNTEQQRIYTEMYDKMVAWVGANKDTPLTAKIAAVKLQRLMQITLATPIIKFEEILAKDEDGNEYTKTKESVELTLPSSKMATALELINDLDEQVVVFTSSKKGAYLFHKYLQDNKVSCEVLSGDTGKELRSRIQKDFRERKFRVFIAVIQAAAEGIDGLQDVCHTAIFLNRSLSAYKNKQAEDRLHRGGQHDTVTIIDIVARDTIDGERLEKLDGTWQSIREILGLGAV